MTAISIFIYATARLFKALIFSCKSEVFKINYVLYKHDDFKLHKMGMGNGKGCIHNVDQSAIRLNGC